MASKQALGKGIASLIQTSNTFSDFRNSIGITSSETKDQKINDERNVLMVDVEEITANPYQPRKIFKDKDLDDLILSIKENGIIQPLIVTRSELGFELIAGERRLRAAKLAGIEKVPVIVKRATDREKLVMAIIENVQRSNLNCVEEALAYYQLMDEYKLTQEEVAKRIGKERSTVANFLRILKLPRKVIEMVQKELLSFGHAKVLAALDEEIKIERLADLTVLKKLSVRELENIIKKKTVVKEKKGSRFFDEKLDGLRQTLEQRTGYHFQLKSKRNGKGEIIIKYNNEAEFNDIYEHLLK